MKWPFKDPDETLDYSIDWSRYLDTDTITSVAWYVEDSDGTVTLINNGETVNGLTSGSQSATDTVATIRLSAGTAGLHYKVTCEITDSSGQVTQRVVQLPVRER